MAVATNQDLPRRYGEIIKLIVGGPFYDARGTILPYRSGPTTLRLSTDSLNTDFGVFVNDVFTGAVSTNKYGDVEFERFLPKGENVVTVINNVSGYRFVSWLTVRDTALWHVAYAEAMEILDDDNLATKENLAIETARSDGLLDVFGERLNVYNNQGLDTDAYRWQLHEIWNAYRNYGGKFRGVETAVAAFTQIPPFGYSRKLWGPNWVLDQQMLANSRFLDRSAEVSYDSSGISGVTINSLEADVPSGFTGIPTMRIRYISATNMLQWGTLTDWGPEVPANNGDLFLPGPPATQDPYILGKVDVIVLASNRNMLYLSTTGTFPTTWGNVYAIDLSLVPGYPVPTVPDLVSYINSEAGDTLVEAYGGCVLFTHPSDAIQVESGPNSAAVAVFGVRKGDIHMSPSQADLPGVSFLEISGDIDISTNAVIEYDAASTSLRWGSNGGMPPAGVGWVEITQDGSYTLRDGLGITLEIYVFFDRLIYLSDSTGQLTETLRASTSVAFSVGYSRVNKRVKQTKGCFVRVNAANLPSVDTLDSVIVTDDASGGVIPETPDRWWLDTGAFGFAVSEFQPSAVVRDKLNDLDPTSAFRYYIGTDRSLSEVTLYGRVLKYPVSDSVTGPSYPQQYPALFYDYEGFSTTFSGWFLSHSSSPVEVTLGFSFDAGVTWIEGATVTVNTDGGRGINDATYVEVETVIPAELTPNGVWVRAHCSLPSGVGGGFNVSMDGLDVDVHHITSRVLGNTTVPRTRHRQFFGELLFVWSPGRLTTVEQAYLGVIHKHSSTSSPLAGVLIQSISDDSPVGKGIIEYEYNADMETYRLRWTAKGEVWPPGAGWVNFISTGVDMLASPRGSFIEVYVTHELLPMPEGASSTAVIFKEVVISDMTVNQGIVRDIAPAHSALDIIDVSEYGNDGRISNVVGSFTEDDFEECELVNLVLNDGAVDTDPAFKTAFLSPARVIPDVVGELLDVALLAPHTAVLDYECDRNQVATLLYEDGIVMPNNIWQFNNTNQVQLLDFKINSIYTIDYRPLYRVTTPLLDLGGGHDAYMWIADYMLWNRMEHDKVTRQAEVPVYFSPDSATAVLKYPSSMDQERATLFYEDADGRVEITKIRWNFVSPYQIKMDPSSYVSGSQYYLIHDEVRIYPRSGIDIIFEHRSGVDSPSCESAAWEEISRNHNVYVDQPSGSHRIHQLRLSVSGARDIRDFKIRSVALKGLHIRGPGANVGGLTNV